MNSPLVHRQIRAVEGSFLTGLLKQPLSDQERIARLFERFLVRRPTPDELTHATQVVASSPDGWEDLQWLLVNKVEFVHNF